MLSNAQKQNINAQIIMTDFLHKTMQWCYENKVNFAMLHDQVIIDGITIEQQAELNKYLKQK
jgi:hypothetical protein